MKTGQFVAAVFIKSLSSVGAFAAAVVLSCSAHAATYSVSGSMTDFHSLIWGADYSISFNPEHPAFTGVWEVDLVAPMLYGSVNFESFWVYEELAGVGSVMLQRPNDTHTISTMGASVVFDPASYTLSIMQAHLSYDGTTENCISMGYLTCVTDTTIEFDHVLAMSLVFDPTLNSFTGTSTYTTAAGILVSSTSWAFSGTEVPLPAAVWLFGAALLGMTGLARHRKIAA